jgi:hypothetical protein
MLHWVRYKNLSLIIKDLIKPKKYMDTIISMYIIIRVDHLI